ncbi:lamin tail domain-containing protein, partial [candidate division WOR-3 bacterium]|nr:lamin tail domain-containing protein [candidate division WOR-3 bacterium]
MKSFVTALAALLFVPGLCPANPVAEYFLSEIQVAPDSLERIEVHMYTRERPFPVDLSGWQVVTSSCTATVNDGIVLEDSNSYVVLSRENLTGPFSLPDDSGEIELWSPGGGPMDWYEYGRYNWAPPAGMSATTHSYW